jgi:hypothetical protein
LSRRMTAIGAIEKWETCNERVCKWVYLDIRRSRISVNLGMGQQSSRGLTDFIYDPNLAFEEVL